jgi:hypothetical protein
VYDGGWITHAELEAMAQHLQLRRERPPATGAA